MDVLTLDIPKMAGTSSIAGKLSGMFFLRQKSSRYPSNDVRPTLRKLSILTNSTEVHGYYQCILSGRR